MTRLISGVILAAAALGAILYLPDPALRVLACAVAALAAHEFVRIVRTDARFVVAAVVLCWVASGPAGVDADLAVAAAIALGAVAVLALRGTVTEAAAGLFGAVYVGGPLAMLAAGHASLGSRATLLLLGTIVVSDSAQFYTGRLFGRHPLAPTISPKKTIEGAAGGLVVATAAMVLAGAGVFPSMSAAALAGLGIVVVLSGICGDLFESALKRAAGLKDSSHLIPGHGGVLDRIDALLFAAPAFYLYLRAVA